MKHILSNIEIKEEWLSELKQLTGWEPKVTYTSENLKTKFNPFFKATWGDFDWLRSKFPEGATVRAFVTSAQSLKELGITDHLGMYDLQDMDNVHDFYMAISDKLDNRAKNNGFKSNFAWMFVHELLHGKEKFSGGPDRVHTMESQGRLKELLEEYLAKMPSAVNKPTVVITHHALSRPDHTTRDVNQWHKERWPDFISRLGYHVGYHYIIETDGTVVQTRYHDEEGAHTLGMNKSSIGVCFMGNFDVDMPSEAQNASWARLYEQLDATYPGIPTAPHRAFNKRTCHGTNLPDNYFQLVSQRYGLLLKVKMLLTKLLASLIQRK